jgi:hypothetical protein
VSHVPGLPNLKAVVENSLQGKDQAAKLDGLRARRIDERAIALGSPVVSATAHFSMQ